MNPTLLDVVSCDYLSWTIKFVQSFGKNFDLNKRLLLQKQKQIKKPNINSLKDTKNFKKAAKD